MIVGWNSSLSWLFNIAALYLYVSNFYIPPIGSGLLSYVAVLLLFIVKYHAKPFNAKSFSSYFSISKLTVLNDPVFKYGDTAPVDLNNTSYVSPDIALMNAGNCG